MRRPKTLSRWTALAAVALTLSPGLAAGRPGYRGPSISTWDTRASSVTLGSTALTVDGRLFSAWTYNTNFSSTSGNLSSQLGVHYLNLAGEERVDLITNDGEPPGAVHGLSFGAITLIERPILERYDNGLPRLAWGAYFGAIPSALIGIDRNFFTAPLVAGVGVPWSPLPWLSVTPWAEISWSYNFDTWLDPDDVDPSVLVSEDEPTASDVLNVLQEALTLQRGGAVSGRGGVSVASHLGQRWDLGVGFTLASLGTDDGRQLAVGGSLGVVFHWDRVVPAALPPATAAPLVDDPGPQRPPRAD